MNVEPVCFPRPGRQGLTIFDALLVFPGNILKSQNEKNQSKYNNIPHNNY